MAQNWKSIIKLSVHRKAAASALLSSDDSRVFKVGDIRDVTSLCNIHDDNHISGKSIKFQSKIQSVYAL